MTTTQPVDAIVARIREALEAGPTPGKWKAAAQPGDVMLGSLRLASVNAADRTLNIGGEVERRRTNAGYIASVSPDAIRALLAHMDELKKDAERLDWLERQDLNDVAVIRQTNDVVGLNVGHGPAYGKTLRAAIDAAMKQGAGT